MSIISRDKKTKDVDPSPHFKMRIAPALREQLDVKAAEQGLRLWRAKNSRRKG